MTRVLASPIFVSVHPMVEFATSYLPHTAAYHDYCALEQSYRSGTYYNMSNHGSPIFYIYIDICALLTATPTQLIEALNTVLSVLGSSYAT